MNDFLKKLRLYSADTTIGVMTVVGAVGLVLVVRRHDASVLPLVALGWTLYLVQEHLVHRFVFHAPAPRTQFFFDVLYRLHYGHHDQIQSKNLLFTPWWFACPLAVLNVGGLCLALPLRDALVAVLGGGVPAYLFFEWLHLTSHIRPGSRGRLGRYVAKRHAKHHFIDHTNWYTVSPGGQVVDRVLGTDPTECHVRSNVRTCGLEPDDPRLVRSRRRFGRDASLQLGPTRTSSPGLGLAR